MAGTTDYLSPNDASYPYGYLDDSSFLSPFFPGSSSPLSPLAGTGLSNFTPTTIGTSLPNTPGNASPLVGQKRSRSSQSPPYQHVTMDQVCPRSGYSTQKPAAVPYSTYNVSHNTHPYVYPNDLNLAPGGASYPHNGLSEYDFLFNSPLASPAGGYTHTHDAQRTSSDPWATPIAPQQQPARQSTRSSPYQVPAGPFPRAASPIQSIRRSGPRVDNSYLSGVGISSDRLEMLIHKGATSHPAVDQQYMMHYYAQQAPASQASTSKLSVHIPGQPQTQTVPQIRVEAPPTSSAAGIRSVGSNTSSSNSSRSCSSSSSSSSSPSLRSAPLKKRRTEVPTQTLAAPSHPIAQSLGTLVPQARYSTRTATTPMATIHFGTHGIRLRDAINHKSDAYNALPQSDPVLDSLNAEKKSNITFRLLWPGGDPKHEAFISLTLGRLHKNRVTLPDLADRVGQAVWRYFTKATVNPVDPVAEAWMPNTRVRFEDLVISHLEQVSSGSWQPVLYYNPAPMEFVREVPIKSRKSKA